MITRIVRMTFQPNHIDSFLSIFDASKEYIRAFDGCLYLSLHRDHHHPNVFYTLSRWQAQADLDAYRESELFRSTWNKTKVLFSEKPTAFSLDPLSELN